MKRQLTARDLQRNDFIENLYGSLRRQAEDTLEGRDEIRRTASEYVADGLDPAECIELLIIDGVDREAAKCYVEDALSEDTYGEESDYAFSFEDVGGRIWSSYEVGQVITASSDEEAWQKAEALMDTCHSLEMERVVSVSKIM